MNYMDNYMLCDNCGHKFKTKDFCKIHCMTPVFCKECDKVMFPITMPSSKTINKIKATLTGPDKDFLIKRLP